MLINEGYTSPQAEIPESEEGEDLPEGSSFSGESSKKQSDSKSKTPVLDNFGRDLTKIAEDGKMDPKSAKMAPK